jgi:hypothetical protein
MSDEDADFWKKEVLVVPSQANLEHEEYFAPTVLPFERRGAENTSPCGGREHVIIDDEDGRH